MLIPTEVIWGILLLCIGALFIVWQVARNDYHNCYASKREWMVACKEKEQQIVKLELTNKELTDKNNRLRSEVMNEQSLKNTAVLSFNSQCERWQRAVDAFVASIPYCVTVPEQK